MLQLPIQLLFAMLLFFQSIQMGYAITQAKGYELIPNKSGTELVDPKDFKYIKSKGVPLSECSVSS